jgi:hypothetical protein
MSYGLTGLAPNTTYHFRIVASNCAGCAGGTTFGSDQSFTTAVAGSSPSQPASGGGGSAASGSPAVAASLLDSGSLERLGAFDPSSSPVLGQSVLVRATSGTVLVQTPAGHPRPLGASARLSLGSIIDARQGVVELTTALPNGRKQAATVWGGQFEVHQDPSRGGMADLILAGGDFSACSRASGHRGHVATAARAAHRAKSSSRVIRSLWVADHHGHYRTHGRNSVATVRGTTWLTADRCDGTLTRVKQGRVSVRANHQHRSVLLSAGHAYLARARRAH